MEADCKHKSAAEYFCDTCEYITNHKSHFDKHLTTSKHIKRKQMETECAETALSNIKVYSCEFCDKIYCNRSGLWKHKKKCNNQQTLQIIMNELVDIKKQNAELKHMLEQNQLVATNNTQTSNSNPTITNVHGDHNNIQNNVFNTQVFLENECKNAVNIDDLIEKVIIDADKLDVFKEKGTSVGIANILNDVLKQYTIYERPIHCSDLKRLSMHVKDKDIWLSKEEGQQKLNQTIYYIQQSAMKNVYDWQQHYKNKLNPDKLDKQFFMLLKKTTNCLTDNDNKKIIKTIASNVKLGEGT